MSSTLSTKEMQQFRSLLPTLTTTLHNFASSSLSFKLLTTITPSTTFPPSFTTPQPSLPAPKTLYILDSSFNPPTLAHARLLTSALSHDHDHDLHTAPHPNPKRLLLLLSTQNADKAPQPASFEHRLIMMTIFARDILSLITSSANANPSSPPKNEPSIDLALTKQPYFHHKSGSIAQSKMYDPETTQVHLLGYDTLIRVLNTKYYPPEYSLSVLDTFLSRHRLRVTYRGDGDSKKYREEKEEQDRYLRDIGAGKRESEGARREWVTRGNIEMIEGRKEGEEVISSTRVREAVRRGDKELLGRLLTDGVKEWILQEGLYLDK